MKEWGAELWDRFNQVVAHSKKETAELESVFGGYLKERGDLEREYSKRLRKLVAHYIPKETKKDTLEEETSQTKAFRTLLQETRYEANQHEALADTLSKIVINNIHKKVKEFGDVAKKCIKEAKKLQEDKDKSERVLDKSRQKYQRAFVDWEQAEQEHSKAETSDDVSRAQIDKLKKSSGIRQSQYEKMRGEYAGDLLRANEEQRLYYYTSLPTVLNNLQNLEISRSEFVRELLKEAVLAEKEILPIIGKCLEEMDQCLDSFSPSQDAQLVIYRYKTGNVPPPGEDFEEMKLGDGGLDKYKTLQKKSKVIPPTENLFPRKRELEKKIEVKELEIQKGLKEIQALRLMIETYSQNPQYGDKKNFQAELEAATFKVQTQESELHTLRTQLTLIDDKLDHIKNRTPVDTPKSGRKSPSASDKGSVGYGTISNSSNSSEQDTDSIGEKPRLPGQGWEEEEEEEEFEDLPPPPVGLGVALALYDFRGEEESNLSMVAGEEFLVLEPDNGGWTKVQRLHAEQEGFVPTSFLQINS